MVETAVRRRKRSGSRKAQLVDVAAQIFLEKGYKETGIELILKQAGLTGPALYRHFKSKQEILDTICLHAGQAMMDVVEQVRNEEGLSPRERMARLLELRLDYLFSRDGVGSFLAASQRAHLSEEAREKLAVMQRHVGSAFSEFLHGIRPDLSDDERYLVFFAVQNMVLYGIWRSRSRGLISEEEYRELLEKMIWDAIWA